MKTTRSILGIGTLALAGTVMTAAAPHAALAQQVAGTLPAIRLHPELHIVGGGLALLNDNTIIFRSTGDPSLAPVGGADQVWKSHELLILPSQNNRPWGWAAMNPSIVNNPATTPGIAAGKLVYDAAPTRNRIYYRIGSGPNAGELGYLQGPTWTPVVVHITGKMVGDPAVDGGGGVYYHEASTHRLHVTNTTTNPGTAISDPLYPMHFSNGEFASPVFDHFAQWGMFYRGNDNRLYSVRPGTIPPWVTIQCTPETNVTSDPAVTAAFAVVHRDDRGYLSSTDWNGSWWGTAGWNPPPGTNLPSVNTGSVVGAPTVGPQGIPYYRGKNDALWSCRWNGSGFLYKQETSNRNVAGDIVVNSAGTVFYRGTATGTNNRAGYSSIWRMQ